MITTDTKIREATRFGILPSTISLKIREPGSAITHFVGLIMMYIGAGPLVMKTSQNRDGLGTFSMLVFVLAACLLYAASTTYHTVVLDKRRTTLFRKFDHMSISIMIAGTYTPICLIVLHSTVGYALLAAVWGLALAGLILKLLWITCPKWLSSSIYLMMGWVCVFAFKPLLATLPIATFGLLLAGGIAYSLGAAIYAMHPRKFDARHIYFGSHEIFHVCIMIGTLLHYIMLWNYVA